MPQTRRTFVKKIALGGAMISLPGLDSLSYLKKPGSEMKMGLVTYLWGKDMDLPTLIETCEKSKVLGVELRINHAHGVKPEMSAAERKEAQLRFDDSKVRFLGMGTNQDYHHIDPAKLKASIEGTKDYIKLSHDIGGTGVKVKPNAFPKGVSKEKTIEQIGKSLNIVGKFAADYGQEIRVEVHGKGTQQLPHIKSIFDIADHPNVKVCWNCNMQDLDGQGLRHNFNLVKGRFGDTVHIREVNVGEYPYQELVDLFVEMDYKGWILLECRTDPSDKVAAMKEQRKLWKKMVKNSQKKL